MGVTEDEMVQYHHWLKGHRANSGKQWRSDVPVVLQPMGS